ncbi:MAG: acetylornithine/succinylornithine family transaminase [Eggerthellaceae bacterium]|nr:acetylornithine/succinylornithine family transaminase [Eggerthellaceae bacterium]
MSEIAQTDEAYVAHAYARFPVEIVSGKGALALSADGRTYIDMGAGIGVNAFGYADPVWCQAVSDQLGTVQHTSNLYFTEPCAMLAKALCDRTGAGKVFFGNSGAEANECAIKVARKYASDKWNAAHPEGGQAPSTIITLENSFHGRTLTTLAATGQDHFHELFKPLTPGFMHIPANDIAALEAACDLPDTCAVMIECVQGEGGVNVLSEEFVACASQFTRERDMVLIIDEVQTGNGRTGDLYAYMGYGIEPDVITTAKGLGAGLPIGACLMWSKVEDVIQPGDHGSTFGGNPVCCAGALSVIERLTDEFLADVRAKSAHIRERLEGAEGIEGISGAGLMIGISTVKPAADVVKTCIDGGVLCLTAKNKVRLLPPLNIPDEVLDQALDVILEACK